MEKVRLKMNNSEEVNTIQNALQTLNDAAKVSSQEIKTMMERDYKKLRSILSDVKPEVRHVFKDLSEDSQQKIHQAKDSVGQSAHQNPWIYIGGATVLAIVVGYMVGRKSS